MAAKHGGWCVCGHEGALDACPKNVCACAPVGMCIKFLESGWNWEKVLYKCAVLLLPLYLFVKQKIVGCLAEMST